ncbi:MAG: hypothetical protein Q8P18_00460 [Pseudomonadota bacterium]|nr:hypothetical protein [Pseudomonadota bacterium]
MLLLFVACATTGALRVDPDVTPVLPSPRADRYTRSPGTPRDPLVAAVSDDLPWDETLSGVAAATALAELDGDKVDACRLRWMAVQAGYPYPLLGRASASVPQGEVPETLLAEARKQEGRRVDIGLVRARGRDVDRWVLLVGEHLDARAGGELPPIPRDVALNDEVLLGPGNWVVSDPLGDLRHTDDRFVADIPGEWMISARGPLAPIATFPIYVDELPPELAPVGCEVGTGDPLTRAFAVVNRVRASYGYPAVTRDPALDSVARARLRGIVAGEPLADARAQLRSAGFIGVPVGAAECRGATVEACVGSIWWSPEGRGALVGDMADIGIAVDTAGGDVHMVLLGAG